MEDRETSLGRRHLSRDSKRMEEPVLRGEGKAFQTEEEVGLVLRFLRGPDVSGLRQDKGGGGGGCEGGRIKESSQ